MYVAGEGKSFETYVKTSERNIQFGRLQLEKSVHYCW